MCVPAQFIFVYICWNMRFLLPPEQGTMQSLLRYAIPATTAKLCDSCEILRGEEDIRPALVAVGLLSLAFKNKGGRAPPALPILGLGERSE